jgi:outer membrane protein insertion porin family
MTEAHLRLVLAFSAMFLSDNALKETPAPGDRLRVGQIFIVGNEFTKQDVILSQLPRTLSPGQTLKYSDLRLAERNLNKLGIFQIDRGKGARPSIYVLERNGDEIYRDVLVEVKEAPTWSVRRMIGVNLSGEVVVSIVFEERNFDLSRFPTSWTDLCSGGAFRGAFQTFRLELIQIPLSRVGIPRFLQMGSFLLPIS